MRWSVVLRAVAAGVALLAVAYVVGVVSIQRKLLFPRPSLAGAAPRPADAQQVWLSTSDGRVEAWFLPPRAAPASPAPLIIFFHGNGELIDGLPEDFTKPRGWGLGVLLVEFPGYGRSTGSPSQESIGAAAVAAHDWARGQTGIDPERIVAYGRSLGGAAAAMLAAQRPTAALVLESTFTSVRSFAHRFGVPELVVLDPFDTLSLLRSNRRPVLVLHGNSDRLIPAAHARRLAEAAASSELHFLRCGHNDCARPWGTLRSFLKKSDVLRD